MKKILLLCIFNFSVCFSQNLKLSEIVSLRLKSIAEVEETLTSKSWTLLEAKQPADGNLGNMTFAFNKSDFDDKAESFFKYMYSEITDTRRVNIQINKKSFYDSYMAQIKLLGCSLVKSKIVDDQIVKVYKGKTTTFEITITTTKDNLSETKTTYYFFITDNEDYTMNFTE